jgi:hypothetical protein
MKEFYNELLIVLISNIISLLIAWLVFDSILLWFLCIIVVVDVLYLSTHLIGYLIERKFNKNEKRFAMYMKRFIM